MDSYGYPLYLMITEGQRSDMNFAIPVLEYISLVGNIVLADKGYNNQPLMNYIHEYGGEFIIPSNRNSKIRRQYD